MKPKPAILILCTGNSCRSRLAEGILRAFVAYADGRRDECARPA